MSDYYPLQIGNRWEYDLIAGGKTVTMVNRIGKVETIDNVPLTVLEATLNDKLIATEHLRHTDKGLLRHRINQFAPDPPLMLLRYPAKAGDQWEGEFKIGAAKATYACRTQEETVEVPAGKFKAIRVNIKVDENGKVVNTIVLVRARGRRRQTIYRDQRHEHRDGAAKI